MPLTLRLIPSPISLTLSADMVSILPAARSASTMIFEFEFTDNSLRLMSLVTPFAIFKVPPLNIRLLAVPFPLRYSSFVKLTVPLFKL